MNRLSLAIVFLGTTLAVVAAEQGSAPLVELGVNANLGGRRLLPDDSPWHRDISKDRVDPNSRRILARIGMNKPLRPNFGTEWEGIPHGFSYYVVAKSQKKVPVTFAIPDESDGGPYPIPSDAAVDGPVADQAGGQVANRRSAPDGERDRNILVLDRDSWTLWELYNPVPDGGGGWKAESGAIWDLKQNQVRPAGWTSADAAGLPILPGLIRYDEVVEKGTLEHALRFTVSRTRRAYVPPASHWASQLHDDDLPPMGMRVRLKADYDVSGFAPEARVILLALKTYGMILASNGGDNFISGAPHPRWNVDALQQLRRVQTKDLEVVEMNNLVIDRRR